MAMWPIKQPHRCMHSLCVDRKALQSCTTLAFILKYKSAESIGLFHRKKGRLQCVAMLLS